MDGITFSAITQLFLESCKASRFSENTLNDYRNTYKRFSSFLNGDPPIASLTSRTIVSFLANVTGVCDKTVLNYHTGLSSLWRWGVEQKIVAENIVRQVKPPEPEQREIIPFSRPEIIRLLRACDEGLVARRDRALVCTLLDTGMRASEICMLQIKDVDFEEYSILAFGKGDKERVLKFCGRTNELILDYLAHRNAHRKLKNLPLFATIDKKALNRHTLRMILNRLEFRSGVTHVHAHRFRHTFAINFLRNGGNVYTLQVLLGHTALDMVKRYLKIAETDLEHDHQKASPVKVWGL